MERTRRGAEASDCKWLIAARVNCRGRIDTGSGSNPAARSGPANPTGGTCNDPETSILGVAGRPVTGGCADHDPYDSANAVTGKSIETGNEVGNRESDDHWRPRKIVRGGSRQWGKQTNHAIRCR